MKPLGPVHSIDLFQPERAALLDLLSSLTLEEWRAPTCCPGWSVGDIAAHVLADDLGVLSRQRDGMPGTFEGPWDDLLAFINRQNEAWVAAMRRLSPRVIIEHLRLSGTEFASYMRTKDLDAMGHPVHWAGPRPAPVWLDVAREYTERWLHQQQIRDAICHARGDDSAAGLKDRHMFAPVLDAFCRALPHTYRDVDAPKDTHLRVVITGEAGGTCSLVRTPAPTSTAASPWVLVAEAAQPPAATVTLDQETAWRLFTRGILPQEARERAKVEGDAALGKVVLEMVSIIA